MPPDLDNSLDDQDQSEVFDEDNYSLDDSGGPNADMKTLEELPDVMDVTSAVGDSDDDAALIGEDLDDDEIIDLETDADLADFEDDELAARMPERLRSDDGGGDVADPRMGDAGRDDVDLVLAGDLDGVSIDDASISELESDILEDDDIDALGYRGGDPPLQEEPTSDRPGAGDRETGSPGEPVRFEIAVHNHLWVLTRDGRDLHHYGHAEQAVHEAAEIARELRRTGQPALVYLKAAEGKIIEITDDDPPAEPAPEEHSAVVPDRSPDA